MRERNALSAILVISLAGVLLLAYTSYMQIFKSTCVLGPEACSKLINIPISIYGLAIFLILFLISLFGLKNIEA